jgi:hypothetical protein
VGLYNKMKRDNKMDSVDISITIDRDKNLPGYVIIEESEWLKILNIFNKIGNLEYVTNTKDD